MSDQMWANFAQKWGQTADNVADLGPNFVEVGPKLVDIAQSRSTSPQIPSIPSQIRSTMADIAVGRAGARFRSPDMPRNDEQNTLRGQCRSDDAAARSDDAPTTLPRAHAHVSPTASGSHHGAGGRSWSFAAGRRCSAAPGCHGRRGSRGTSVDVVIVATPRRTRRTRWRPTAKPKRQCITRAPNIAHNHERVVCGWMTSVAWVLLMSNGTFQKHTLSIVSHCTRTAMIHLPMCISICAFRSAFV